VVWVNLGLEVVVEDGCVFGGHRNPEIRPLHPRKRTFIVGDRLEAKKNSDPERSLFLMNWLKLALEFISETSQNTVVGVFYVKIRGAIRTR
jgi:hypothetical protein